MTTASPSIARLRRWALAVPIAVAALASLSAAAPPAAAQVCPYGYYYSDGACWPYSWQGSSGAGDDFGAWRMPSPTQAAQ